MKFFARLSAKKNTDRLMGICMDLIDQFEKEGVSGKPSCKSDLRELLKIRFKDAEEEIAEWQDFDTDYIRIAHVMLTHGAFDLLASGKYHIYTGMLNPMNCSSNLMLVYKKAMEYSIKNNMITEEEKQEDYEYLLKCISEVG